MVRLPSSLLKRNCNKTAAAPTAAMITTDSGLKKALRSVKVTKTASTPHNKPAAMTVFRRGVEEVGNR